MEKTNSGIPTISANEGWEWAWSGNEWWAWSPRSGS